jgi:hypothetical protein
MVTNKEHFKFDIKFALRQAPGPLKAKTLAAFAGIQELDKQTCPMTRMVIRELIDEGMLIGSTSKGYRLMKTGKEVQQCLNSLLKRTIGINTRIQAIYDAAKKGGIL